MFGRKQHRQGLNENSKRMALEEAERQEQLRSHGMRGPRRRMETDADYYNIETPGLQRAHGHSGTYDSNSWNADEREGRWILEGRYAGLGPKNYRRSDERLYEEICELLTRNQDVDASEIEVDVKEAIVTLSGSIESRKLKRLVEDLVENINGVRDIKNDLQVGNKGISPEFSEEYVLDSASERISTSARSAKLKNKTKAIKTSGGSRRDN